MRAGKVCWVLGLYAAVALAQSPGTFTLNGKLTALSWQPIGNGLPQASIGSFLFADPAKGSTVYAIASNLLFKSTDGSDSWTALSGVTGVYSVLIDPKDSATLYAGTSHGVLKSTNGGSIWTGINSGLPQGWPAWAQVRAIDPIDSSVLYVQKWQGLFKSTDGGRSWNPLNARFYASGSATPLADFEVQTLIIDPAQPSTMYAGPGLYKTTDGGATWRAVSANQVTGSSFSLLAFDPATTTLFAFGNLDPNHNPGSGQLFKSTDRGTTWTPTGRGFPNSTNASFVFDPKNAGTIYAPYVQLNWSGGAPPAFGLVKSTDGGESWTAISPASPGTYIRSFAVDANSTLFVSYSSEGAFKSADGGANWNAVKAVPATVDVPGLTADPGLPDVLYAAAGEDGIFRSADRGANWTKLSGFQFKTDLFGQQTVSASYLAMDPRSSQLLYAGSICLLYKSADAGVNWQNLNATSDCGTSGFVALDPHDSNTFYLAQVDIVDGGSWLQKTADGGTTWRTVWSSRDYIVALAIDPVTPTTIYAGIARFAESGKGLLKSTDGGANWSEVDVRLGVNVLAIDPLHPNVVYAATATDDYWEPTGFAGLFKSVDAGASWSVINSGLENLLNTGAQITALIFHSVNPNILFAATSGNGVFRSRDGGLHWSHFNDGLTNFDVHALAIAPGMPALLYASTSGGLFVIPVSDERPRASPAFLRVPAR